MRVVLDTNLLLSARLSDKGPPHRIYEAWRRRRFDLLTATVQTEEVRRASRYPTFQGTLNAHLVGTMINTMRGAEVVDPILHATDEPLDSWLLSPAEAGGAGYLATGDGRSGLLGPRRTSSARTLIAAAFWDLVA